MFLYIFKNLFIVEVLTPGPLVSRWLSVRVNGSGWKHWTDRLCWFRFRCCLMNFSPLFHRKEPKTLVCLIPLCTSLCFCMNQSKCVCVVTHSDSFRMRFNPRNLQFTFTEKSQQRGGRKERRRRVWDGPRQEVEAQFTFSRTERRRRDRVDNLTVTTGRKLGNSVYNFSLNDCQLLFVEKRSEGKSSSSTPHSVSTSRKNYETNVPAGLSPLISCVSTFSTVK